MLRAGLAIARRAGLRSVTVRGVATRSRANLGSFVYHFGTRDAFLGEMIEFWYAPLFAQLQLTVDEAQPVTRRLRQFCLALLGVVIAQREFIAQLIVDAASGEQSAQRFMRTMRGRHPALLLRLIREAQAVGDIHAGEDALHVMLFIFAALGMPVIAVTGLARARLLPAGFAQAITHHATALPSIERRLDWVLDGLRPRPARSARSARAA
jgi:AcrR family transcriptional regulator